jgi:hypothetical protein
MPKQKNRLAKAAEPAPNATFLHPEDGGLTDELMKRQIEDQEAKKRDLTIADVSVRDIAEGNR